MKMTQKLFKIFGCLVLGVCILYGFSEFKQTAGALYEKALFLEEARGELQEAIAWQPFVRPRGPSLALLGSSPSPGRRSARP